MKTLQCKLALWLFFCRQGILNRALTTLVVGRRFPSCWRCKSALAGVFAKQKLRLLLLAWTLIAISCFSPLGYKGSGEEGAITIDFGRGAVGARVAAWPCTAYAELAVFQAS